MTTQDEKGWIEWKGKGAPVPPDQLEAWRLRDGMEYFADEYPEMRAVLDWRRNGSDGDIIAYRVVQP